MPAELIVLVAAIFIAWLIFTWLIRVVKVSITTAIMIAAVVLFLQIVFGIGFQEVWQQLINLIQNIWQFFSDR
jgi:O-antigen ligase